MMHHHHHISRRLRQHDRAPQDHFFCSLHLLQGVGSHGHDPEGGATAFSSMNGWSVDKRGKEGKRTFWIMDWGWEWAGEEKRKKKQAAPLPSRRPSIHVSALRSESVYSQCPYIARRSDDGAFSVSLHCFLFAVSMPCRGFTRILCLGQKSGTPGPQICRPRC